MENQPAMMEDSSRSQVVGPGLGFGLGPGLQKLAGGVHGGKRRKHRRCL
ncbi:hypothetical protein MtrunA17_Chr8g0337001 [Medicago truncatula]|uniref:Uncharacterized protein n=1 Tax=Medicago truncatula TaxID=3880 RepID=A0A396GAM6_MEDTR|nr:hypothetical protein MtrunA17_Chr8g0337001 [Medicago truncatula]